MGRLSQAATGTTPRGASSRRPTTRSTRSGRATAEAGIDAGFHKGGEIIVSRGPAGRAGARGTALQRVRRFGFGDRYRLVDAAELADRIRIAGAVRGARGRRRGGRPPGPARARPGARGRADGTRILEGTRGDGFRPKDASRAGDAGHGARRGPGAGRRARRRGVPDRAAGAPPPAGPAVVADRAHGAAVRRPMGRDRLGQPRDARLDPALGRLPVTHRGRPDPVRRPRRAVPVRVADPARVRPPRPDPRPAAGVRPRVVPVARAASGSPTPGAARWACRGTGTRRWRSTRSTGIATRARLRRSRRVHDEPRGPRADRPDHRRARAR